MGPSPGRRFPGPGWDPTARPVAVQEALISRWNSLAALGRPVYRFSLMAGVISGVLPGVAGVPTLTDVPAFTIGISPSPTGTADLAGVAGSIYSLPSAEIVVTTA